jgi:preprotein translocase subunit SecG
MYTLLIVVLVLVSLVLIAAILLQAGKGGGLAASFGGATSSADAFVGTRQAANLLTRASWWAGGIFLLLGFVLQILSTRSTQPRSVLDRTFTEPARTAPATQAPASGTPATAVPLEPAEKATTPAPAPDTSR